MVPNLPARDQAEISDSNSDSSNASSLEKSPDPGACSPAEAPITKYLLWCVFIAAAGTNTVFGYSIGVINSPAKFLMKWMGENHWQLFGYRPSPSEMNIIFPAAVAFFPIGAMIGALTSGFFADLLGRRRTLHVNNIFSLLGTVCMTSAYFVDFYPLFHIGRLIIGLAVGIGSSVLPIFLIEISPAQFRGTIGSIPQVVVTICILLSQIAGLPQLFGNDDYWPYLFAFPLIPSVFQLIFLFGVPESPKYTLIFKNDRDQAVSDLAKYRNLDPNHEIVNKEIAILEKEQKDHSSEEKVTVWGLFNSTYIWPLFIVCYLQFGQQLSGINTTMFYSTAIFNEVLTGHMPQYMTLLMGLINVIQTFVSIYLVEHPKFGRRFLLLIGNVGIFMCTVLLTASIHVHNLESQSEIVHDVSAYMTVILVMLFVIFFATGPGSIPFFYVSEVFDSNARASASALSVGTNWTLTFIVGITFPLLQQILGEFVFLIFAASLLVTIVFTVFFVPETKNKSVEQINVEIEKMRKAHACF